MSAGGGGLFPGDVPETIHGSGNPHLDHLTLASVLIAPFNPNLTPHWRNPQRIA